VKLAQTRKGAKRGWPFWTWAPLRLCASLLSIGLLASCERPSANGAIQINVLMEPDGTGVWHELFREFQRQNRGITVNHIEGPAATNAREDAYVTSLFSGQSSYDLIFADVVWVPKFAAAGWLEDLTDRWPGEQWKQFIPASVEGGRYRGRIYRVPTQMDAGMLYYRRDLIEAAREPPPRTLDEFVRIAQKLQTQDVWGFVWQGKQYEGLSCVFLEVLAGQGGTWIDAQTSEVGLDQPPAVAALEFLTRCVREWRISPPGVNTYAEEESRRLFQSGHAVFMRNWPYAFSLTQRPDSPMRGKIGLVPMPAGAGGQSAAALGGWGLCIARSGAHKDACWKLIEFLSTLPQAERLFRATGIQPALKEYYERSSDPDVRAIYEVMQRAVPRPTIPQYAQASDILQRYVSAALSGQLAPREALERAAKETRLLLGRAK
jgi:multiple sugar transport system substrate-binding protein